MNRNCKYYKKYYLKNCYNCNKLNNLEFKINKIYCRLYQTGCMLNGISKACDIGKIYCGIQNLMKK
ncbi:MAG: hypothetical protein E7311_03865 [Clostridiales bacterium]|nr:hypothetical protein [Clostridiales bacterium]